MGNKDRAILAHLALLNRLWQTGNRNYCLSTISSLKRRQPLLSKAYLVQIGEMTLNEANKDNLILIIQDAAEDLTELATILKLAGIKVLVAENEYDALVKAASAQINVILLDMSMSSIDGWKIASQLKTNPKTNEIPLILLGGLATIINKVEKLAWDNIDYLDKPVNLKMAMAAIDIHLASQSIEQQLQLEMENSPTAEFISANHELISANQKLLDSNQDLENFAAVISRDLQAPLRSLRMFAELLTQKYCDKLDEDANKYIQHIANSGSRMQALIHDLIDYSRAGKSEQTWLSISLEDLVNHVIQDLQATIQKTKATIIVKDLPVVWVNPAEIGQVFQNIIENALKFCRHRQPYIEIDATQRQDRWLISVQDNGIGIRPEFQEQIFQVCQQLDPANGYSGTGLGLAICQKIIHRYEGEIWVESDPGKGSTFYFTLPMNLPLKRSFISVG